MPFKSNIFINCPFDRQYVPLLKALVFELLFLELEPQLCTTRSSSDIRIQQIVKLIQSSRYSIHDLSRSRYTSSQDNPRFNMPYELGLDIGCKTFGGKRFAQKKVLVLEKEKYHYQKVLSDIAGQDILNHNDDPATLMGKVRDWLSNNKSKNILPSTSSIWNAYNQFNSDLQDELEERNYSKAEINEMPIGDYIKFARSWIGAFKLS